MKVDVTQIPLADLAPGTLLVARVESHRDVRDLYETLRGVPCAADVAVLILPATISLEAMDEATMNAAGWYRHRPEMI